MGKRYHANVQRKSARPTNIKKKKKRKNKIFITSEVLQKSVKQVAQEDFNTQ